jgi:hypothetical protein
MIKLLGALFIGFATLTIADATPVDKDTARYIFELPNDLGSPQAVATYLSYPNFKAFAVELVDGKISNEFAQRSGNMGSQREANDVALIQCETKNGNDCILFYEGNTNVLKKNLFAYNSGNLKGWLNGRIEICKKYGFQSNQVGSCVQNAVNRILDIPQMSKEEYQNQQNSKIVQMRRQRPNYNWDAISNLGKCIGNGTCWPANRSSPVRPTEIPNQRPSCKYVCGIGLGEVIYTNDFICQPKIYRNGKACWQRF